MTKSEHNFIFALHSSRGIVVKNVRHHLEEGLRPSVVEFAQQTKWNTWIPLLAKWICSFLFLARALDTHLQQQSFKVTTKHLNNNELESEHDRKETHAFRLWICDYNVLRFVFVRLLFSIKAIFRWFKHSTNQRIK